MTHEKLVFVEIDKIEIPEWVRQTERDYLEESVKERGVLMPIILARLPDGRLLLVDGMGRLQLAKERGDKKIPARIIQVSQETDAILLSIELEKTRKEWSHAYTLRLINYLIDKGYTKKKIAKILKISRSVLYRYLYAAEMYQELRKLDQEIANEFMRLLDGVQLRENLVRKIPLKFLEELNSLINKCKELGIPIDYSKVAMLIVKLVREWMETQILYKEDPLYLKTYHAFREIQDFLEALADKKDWHSYFSWGQYTHILRYVPEIDEIIQKEIKEEEEETEEIKELARKVLEKAEREEKEEEKLEVKEEAKEETEVTQEPTEKASVQTETAEKITEKSESVPKGTDELHIRMLLDDANEYIDCLRSIIDELIEMELITESDASRVKECLNTIEQVLRSITLVQGE